MRRPSGRPRPPSGPRPGQPLRPADHHKGRHRGKQPGRRPHPLDAVVLPARRVPRRVVAHLGPANSGKTHAGLDALVEAGSGAYAAPLRMLANEAYERLAGRLGRDRVGLVTGEERINERAPVIACTVEMLPAQRRGVVVLDEVHWASDPERGSAWTRILWHSGADELHLAGAPDAEPMLSAAFGEALEIVWTERLTGPLTLVGGVAVEGLPPATVVVAFSRAAVIALAARIHAERGRRVGVLYGAMPVAARRDQIERFVSGETEVLVSTDVLGHGVNLPCRSVLFAETTKYDGIERRDLLPWEVAQIAGRAGRFGLHEDGEVGWLTGIRWLRPDGRVVARGLQPLAGVGEDGEVPAYRRLTRAQLGPARSDLGRVPPHRWAEALEAWSRAAHAAVKDAGWLRTAPVAPIRDRLLAVGPMRLRRLPPDDAWSLALAPVDPGDGGQLLARLADAILTNDSLADLVDRRGVHRSTITEAESLSAQAAVMRWFTRRHPGVGGITSTEADALEAAASARVIELVPATIEGTPSGRCLDCGAETAPWFRRCDACEARSREAAASSGPSGSDAAARRDREPRSPRPPLNRAARRRRARRG
ncbi:MAG TPA: helicase-related protein [Candidatus Limnocylindrales bacterium]|nr:helicase-related protein [Candidatus Limnocylindrales bacterium]